MFWLGNSSIWLRQLCKWHTSECRLQLRTIVVHLVKVTQLWRCAREQAHTLIHTNETIKKHIYVWIRKKKKENFSIRNEIRILRNILWDLIIFFIFRMCHHLFHTILCIVDFITIGWLYAGCDKCLLRARWFFLFIFSGLSHLILLGQLLWTITTDFFICNIMKSSEHQLFFVEVSRQSYMFSHALTIRSQKKLFFLSQ